MRILKAFYVFLLAAVAAVFILSCSKNKDLNGIQQLVEQKDYQQAITELDKILAKDPANKEAKLLKIRASMLLKTMQRSPEPQEQQKEPQQEGSRSRQHNGSIEVKVTKTAAEKGFSIMSLSGGNSDLSEITKKLSTN